MHGQTASEWVVSDAKAACNAEIATHWHACRQGMQPLELLFPMGMQLRHSGLGLQKFLQSLVKLYTQRLPNK